MGKKKKRAKEFGYYLALIYDLIAELRGDLEIYKDEQAVIVSLLEHKIRLLEQEVHSRFYVG